MAGELKIQVEVWIASRILGEGNRDFAKPELTRFIKDTFRDERPGISTHISSYCVASVEAKPGKFRYLTSVGRGVFRVYRLGDPVHPSKANSPMAPSPEDIPSEYRFLLEKEAKQSLQRDSLTPPTATQMPTNRRDSSASLANGSPIGRLPERYNARPVRAIGDIPFIYIGPIEPTRDENGRVKRFMPQGDYANANGLRLNKYGNGPFCQFRLPADLVVEGVYALIVNDSVKYVGECESLASRYNIGYGQISPRNCYEGGQNTNCKVNNLILQLAEKGEVVHLWFHLTDNRKTIERGLLSTLTPPWNGSL